MLNEYLIQCGLILQLVPPGAAPLSVDALPIDPPAIVESVNSSPHQDAFAPLQLDKPTINELIDLRNSVGIGPLTEAKFLKTAGEFEEVLRAEFGGAKPRRSPQAASPQATVELLRTSCEQLDDIANQLERINNYPAADDLRELGQQLRLHARGVGR